MHVVFDESTKYQLLKKCEDRAKDPIEREVAAKQKRKKRSTKSKETS